MQLSSRGLVLLLVGAVLLALCSFSMVWLGIGVVYLVVLVCFAFLDYVTSPLFDRVEVAREMDSKFSLGAENAVVVRIRNNSRHGLRCWLKDDFPVAFQFDQVVHEFQVEPRSTYVLTYHLKPVRRGLYRFEDIHLRCVGVLGLVSRQRRVSAGTEVKVYPNLLEVQKYELLVRRGMLHEMGLKSSRQFGEGTELERLREYHPDDNYRRIDWKATSRRHRPIVREFETERSQDIVIMLDTGRLMALPIGDLVQLDYAINTALMTSYVCTLKGDKVGLLAFSDTVHQYIAPKPGRKQFLAMLELLYDVQEQLVEPSFEYAFEYLASKHRKRALIILFTNILDKESAGELSTYMAQLAKHHLVVCVTLTDSNILALAELSPRESKEVYRKVIAEKLLREKREALEVLVRHGVITIDVPAHQLSMAVINKYLELKGRSMI